VHCQNQHATLVHDAFLLNKNSCPSPDDDTNFDDAPPQHFEHFKKFQITSYSSSHIHLHVVLLVCSNSLKMSLLVKKLLNMVIVSCEKCLEEDFHIISSFILK
jgi:hypothetical protein